MEIAHPIILIRRHSFLILAITSEINHEPYNVSLSITDMEIVRSREKKKTSKSTLTLLRGKLAEKDRVEGRYRGTERKKPAAKLPSYVRNNLIGVGHSFRTHSLTIFLSQQAASEMKKKKEKKNQRNSDKPKYDSSRAWS